jgi:hypothetical protein
MYRNLSSREVPRRLCTPGGSQGPDLLNSMPLENCVLPGSALGIKATGILGVCEIKELSLDLM